MKLFGYDVNDGEERVTPRTLREASITATPETLRALARFLEHCAARIDDHGEAFGHEHFSDFSNDTALDVDIIVARRF